MDYLRAAETMTGNGWFADNEGPINSWPQLPFASINVPWPSLSFPQRGQQDAAADDVRVIACRDDAPNTRQKIRRPAPR